MNKLQLSFMRLLHNTPVDITNEHMGSQSVLFEGSVQYDPLQALVNRVVEHKGVMENPWIYAIITYCKQSDLSLSRIK